MDKRFFSILALFSSVIGFTANAAVSVSGRIIDKTDGTPLEYANVLLLSLPDSIFVSGTVSNSEGLFRFSEVGAGKYAVKVSYIGYETATLSCEVSSNP
ncbi:MAG: carboxypeptidase-like regulatory domain-containing protein, partial [Prevotellaceae bacterium]|nr:carboxypeptidase-like regulatory domain-containing protein [Prevotellaceae bacterium]